MKKIGVAILGLGAVGGSTYQILTRRREFYERTQGIEIEVESTLEPVRERAERLGVPAEKIAANIAEIVLDPDVNAVVECIGGVDVARKYVLAALHAGKTVVTSNKELIAKYYPELVRTAKMNNAGLYFGASCAGVPIVRTLLDGVQSNEISALIGIVNGTANDILTKMEERGCSYEEAAAEAETDRAAEEISINVEGIDAAYRLSILASVAFHTKVPAAKVFREGIANVSPADLAGGKELGYRLKPLAIAKRTKDSIEVRVHPAFIRQDHPLASVKAANAVFLTGDPVGDVMLCGNGTGDAPAASAIVSDLIFAATHGEHRYSAFGDTAAGVRSAVFATDFTSAYYLRLTVCDEAGALAKVASVLGKYNISIAETMQKRATDGQATLILVTHETRESLVKKAVAKLNAAQIAQVESVLRVAL